MFDSLQAHGILQDRILEWVAISSSRGSSQTRDRNQISFIAGRFLTSHKGSPRILEWVAYPFSSGSFWPRNQTNVSCIAGRFLTNWVTREATKRNGSEIKLLYEQYLPSIITRWNFLSSSFQASGLYMPGWKREMGVDWSYMCLPDWNVIKQFLFSDLQVSSVLLLLG